jgi:perosamine synthetase
MSREGVSRFIYAPMAEPDLGELERGYINEAIIDNQIGHGRFIALFEDAWANFNKFNYGVSCNSGTNAIYLAIKALEGGRILMPNFTMAGTAWPALYDNHEVTYYKTREDVPLANWEIDYTGYDIVVFAHIYGRKAYPDGFVKKLKEKHPTLMVIDDMAEAHGIEPEGDIACYSFYGNKILTTGEGGMCLTNNPLIEKEMRSLANMYFDDERSMIHPKIGHNFRMTNLQAAIGLAQVERAKEILKKRAEILGWYEKHMPEQYKIPGKKTLWFYDVRVKNAEKTKKKLRTLGIDSRRFFYPMSLQPWGNGMPDPVALKWYKQGLLLPAHNTMIEADVKNICETLQRVV